MGLSKGKCPKCNELIEYDSLQDTGVCEKCGHAFIASDIKKEDEFDIDPDSFETLQKKAVVYLSIEEYDKAKQTCQKIIYLYPDMVFGWFGLAKAISKGFSSTKNYEVTMKNLDKAISLASPKELAYIRQNSKGFANEKKLKAYRESKKKKNIIVICTCVVLAVLGIILLICGASYNTNIPKGTNYNIVNGKEYDRSTGSALMVGGIVTLVVGIVCVALWFAFLFLKQKIQSTMDKPLQTTDYENDDYVESYLKNEAKKKALQKQKAQQQAQAKAKQQALEQENTFSQAQKKLPSDLLLDLPFEAPKPKKKRDDFHG